MHMGWVARALALVLGGLVWCGLAEPAHAQPVPAADCAAQIVAVERAQAELRPEGLPATQTEVPLAHRWDLAYPGRGGSATYLVQLQTPCVPDQPMALMIAKVGNQATVRVNGALVAQMGRLGDSAYDAAKAAQLVVVPATLLRQNGLNELRVDATLQRQRAGGLSMILYGPQAAMNALALNQFRWRFVGPLVIALSLAVMGTMALALWWRQRDPLYGTFGLAAWLGVVRNLDQVWPDVPIPWPLWGAIVAICYACHLAMICRFTLGALNLVTSRMARFIAVVMLLVTALAAASFAFGLPQLWTLGLALLVPLGVLSCAKVFHAAWVRRLPIAWVLTAAGALAIAAGVHDLVWVRITHSSGLVKTYTSDAMFAFVLIMAGLVVERYSRTVLEFRALNAELAARVAERERQLGLAFEALREREKEQAVMDERQRIMREIHDGVGSQLVGLLNMVNQPECRPQDVEEHVKDALDEMRMAVDSMQPLYGELTTALATLRYRLQPRLQAAGIEVLWEMGDLPPMPQLSPHAVLQIQRLLLEAFTNVLRHSGATQVRIWAGPDPDNTDRLKLSVSDNGRGTAQSLISAGGQGLANMRHRAVTLGARLALDAAPGGGVRVTLWLPIHLGAA